MSKMRLTVQRAVIVAAAVALSRTGANADQPIFGKKLLIKNPPSGAVSRAADVRL